MPQLGHQLRGKFQNNDSIHICTAGDDTKTLIWDVTGPTVDLGNGQIGMIDPILTHKCEEEINMLQWPITEPQWISIVMNNKLNMLHV